MKDGIGVGNAPKESELLLQGLPRLRVLLIEDGQASIAVAGDVIRDIDGDVVVAKNATEALALLLRGAFSVILCNAHMGSQEGVKIAETVVRNPLTDDIPIIFLHELSGADYLSFSSSKSAPVDYVQSPINTNLLVSKVNTLLLLAMQSQAILRMEGAMNLSPSLNDQDSQHKGILGSSEFDISGTAGRGELANFSTNAAVESHLAERMAAVTRFSAVVAHDFNNILAIILGNLELLEYEDIDNQNVHSRLASIQKSADRACGLTSQVLAISRQHAKRVVETNANETLRSLTQLSAAELPAHVTLSLNLDKSLWLISIDPDDFEEALQNLIVNAFEAMPESGKLTLETANVTLDQQGCDINLGLHPGDYIELSVTDTGGGIAADLRPVVFEPFISSKDDVKGSGLGLSQVYAFCKRSSGHVRLQTGCEGGTTARLLLPRA